MNAGKIFLALLGLTAIGMTAYAVAQPKAPKLAEPRKKAGETFTRKVAGETKTYKVEQTGHVTDTKTGEKVNIVGYKKAGQ